MDGEPQYPIQPTCREGRSHFKLSLTTKRNKPRTVHPTVEVELLSSSDLYDQTSSRWKKLVRTTGWYDATITAVCSF